MPSKPRDEIILRTLMAKRLDLYVRSAAESLHGLWHNSCRKREKSLTRGGSPMPAPCIICRSHKHRCGKEAVTL